MFKTSQSVSQSSQGQLAGNKSEGKRRALGSGSRGSASPSCRLEVAAKLDSTHPPSMPGARGAPCKHDLAAGRVLRAEGLDPPEPPRA